MGGRHGGFGFSSSLLQVGLTDRLGLIVGLSRVFVQINSFFLLFLF